MQEPISGSFNVFSLSSSLLDHLRESQKVRKRAGTESRKISHDFSTRWFITEILIKAVICEISYHKLPLFTFSYTKIDFISLWGQFGIFYILYSFCWEYFFLLPYLERKEATRMCRAKGRKSHLIRLESSLKMKLPCRWKAPLLYSSRESSMEKEGGEKKGETKKETALREEWSSNICEDPTTVWR